MAPGPMLDRTSMAAGFDSHSAAVFRHAHVKVTSARATSITKLQMYLFIAHPSFQPGSATVLLKLSLPLTGQGDTLSGPIYGTTFLCTGQELPLDRRRPVERKDRKVARKLVSLRPTANCRADHT